MSQDTDLPLYLHAELLPNIRHLTLYISLPPTPPLQPDLTLSPTRRAITVSLPPPFTHIVHTIQLPAQVNPAARLTLRSPSESHPSPHTRELSYRMQLDEHAAPHADEALDTFVPWTASDLGPATRLRCRRCETVVLDKCASDDGSSPGWRCKDLPSGNWAEMMDFWHCHKPDPEPGDRDQSGLAQEQSAALRGFGAANRVVAARGGVLVDVATVLLAEGDCRGVELAPDPDPDSPDEPSLRCTHCKALLGVEDHPSQGWRLFKTSLSVLTSATDPSLWETHPVETIVAAQLLELIERESARRFVLHSGQNTGLLLWVFNPDLRYSNSDSNPEHRTTAQRAMKVLFQRISNVDDMLHPRAGQPAALSLEELRLPAAVFADVAEVLRRRNAMLPESARVFREWDVAVLHRYERGLVDG